MQLLSGNQAILKGILTANVGFFSAYPITPASEIMQEIAKIQNGNKNIKFIQAEDEIAAINMCIGASLAGDKVLTATSGPGFSLMQESIGLAFKIESPLVIIDSQRVGPSTGMPTLASQGDILQSRYGSHGDYVNIVFYPNSVEEYFYYIIQALNAAEESLSPVVMLADGIIGRAYETVDLSKIKYFIKRRSLKPLDQKKRHFTGLTSENGIPKTKNSDVYRTWYRERKKKILTVADKYNFYEYYGNKKSDVLIIAYGISSRVISVLKKEYAIFRPIRLFPISKNLVNIANKYAKIVVVEMNDGQYRHELESFLKRDIDLISQLGGKISLNEIKNELKRIY